MKFFSSFAAVMTAVAAVVVFSGKAWSSEPLSPAIRKKIIEFGWDNPTPEYLDQNLEQIEMYVPHDGIGIKVQKNITLPDGKRTSSQYYNFTKIPFQREWYEADIEHLKKVHARAGHLKYNFLNTSASSFTGEFDLFDDEFWGVVCDKFAIFAWVAKQGGCKGICLDLEDYGNQQVWSYRPSCGHSFQEAWEKARFRGRQWMNAVAGEYPDITLFFYFWLDLFLGYADDSPDRFARLESCPNGLLAAFMNGIYDVLPSEAKIVDGMEAYGYDAHTLTDYHRMLALRKERFPKLLTDENRLKFLTRGSFACATHMKEYYDDKGKFQDFCKEENMTMLEFFRRNFSRAVQFSDEYVWTWSNNRKWFPIPFSYAWQEKTLLKHPAVPGPYAGMAIPGVEDAIRYARDPWKYAVDLLKEPGRLKNLLRNPDFESSEGNSDSTPAPDSEFHKGLPHWQFWQKKDSMGTFSPSAGQGVDGSTAMQATGVIQGCAHQSVKIDPNGAYIVRVRAKVSGKCRAFLKIQWRNGQEMWCSHSMSVSAPFTEDMEDGWKRATLVVPNIPENVLYLCPMLYSNAETSGDSVLFDNVEVFSMFDKEPAVAPHLREAMEQWQRDHAVRQEEKTVPAAAPK